jgi:TnpA family transposase
MALEGNYVDSHGQTEIGFAISFLLGFDLLPRIKQINKARIYQPDRGDPDAYPGPHASDDAPDPLGADRAELRHARRVRDRGPRHTASTEAILPRFTRNASHPVYQAMLELGRVQKTIFIARYLRDRDLQREIEEGLNLIEAWNRVNGAIFYGKSGEFATNRRDQQELGMLSLHILQAALVYVNTLMIQDILAQPEWADVLTPEDLRGLTPLFWSHVPPYGEVKLNMTRRLAPLGRPDHRPGR